MSILAYVFVPLDFKPLIQGYPLSCTPKTVDKYQRTVAVCYQGNVDVSRWMIENGYALAYRKYSQDYISYEQYAQHEVLGIWAGEFDTPWDWRLSRKK